MGYYTLAKALTWLLPYGLHIESFSVEAPQGLDRRGRQVSSLVIRLTSPPGYLGRRDEGFGELRPGCKLSQAEAVRVLHSLGLARDWKLGEYLEVTRGLAGARPELAFALELAGFNLALRHLGQGFCDPVVSNDEPLRFVVSIHDDPAPHEAMAEYLAADPSLEFRLVASLDWGQEVWTALTETPQLRVLSLGEIDPEVVSDPEAVAGLTGLSRPAGGRTTGERQGGGSTGLGLRNHDLCWDDDFESVEHIKTLARPGDYVCIKPSLLGSLQRLAEVVAFCEQAGMKMYGGDQGEIGPTREQHQAIASGLYPNGPNNLAPYEYYSQPRPQGSRNPIEPRYHRKGGLRFRTFDYVDPWYRDTDPGAMIEVRREEFGLEMVDVANQIGWDVRAYQDLEGNGDDYLICCGSLREAKTVASFLDLDFLTLCGLSRSNHDDDEELARWRSLPRHELVKTRRVELGLSVDDVSKRAGWGDAGEWGERLLQGAESDPDYLDNEVSTADVVDLALALEIPPELLLGLD